jgi:hypothetical protein
VAEYFRVFGHVGFFRFRRSHFGFDHGMFFTENENAMTYTGDETSEKETVIETHLRIRLGSRVRQLRVMCRNDGIVLCGSAGTYHAKQLAQHLVMEMTDVPILANEIEVH